MQLPALSVFGLIPSPFLACIQLPNLTEIFMFSENLLPFQTSTFCSVHSSLWNSSPSLFSNQLLSTRPSRFSPSVIISGRPGTPSELHASSVHPFLTELSDHHSHGLSIHLLEDSSRIFFLALYFGV